VQHRTMQHDNIMQYLQSYNHKMVLITTVFIISQERELMEFRKKRSKTHSLGLSGQVKRKRFSTITADTSEILSIKVGGATTESTLADVLAVDETLVLMSAVLQMMPQVGPQVGLKV